MRVPPQSIEAEASLLGALLLDQDAFDEIANEVSPEDFYKESHRHIFRSMQKIVGRQEVVDAVTLVEQLSSEQLLDAVGGMAYIAGLTGQVPTAANVAFYSNIVHRKSVLRKLISISAEITEDCYGDIDDLESFLNTAESKILTLGEERTVSRVQSLKDVVKAAYYHIEALYERDEKITGVPSGFLDLDQITAGWQGSDLIIIAARPAMGKCLSAEAELLLEDGSVATIESIVKGERGRILTLGDDWKFGLVSPSVFVDDGVKPVFEVTTRLGRSIEVTASHPFRKVDGWHPLADLEVGDRVAVPRVLDVFGRDSWRECEVKLLAYFIGDGSLTGPCPRFTQASGQIQSDFLAAVSSFGGVVATTSPDDSRTPTFRVRSDPEATSRHRQDFAQRLKGALASRSMTQADLAGAMGVSPASVTHWVQGRGAPSADRFERLCVCLGVSPQVLAPEGDSAMRRGDPNPVANWLTELGLNGLGSHDKFIPGEVFRLERGQLALFLNRLFSTDGWASELASGQIQVGYSSVSLRLMRQVQHLLLRFGIIGSLEHRKIAYKEGHREAWQLDITHEESLRIFAKEIGILGKEKALLRHLSKEPSRSPNCDTIPASIWAELSEAKGSEPWVALARRAGLRGASNIHVGQRGLSRERLEALSVALDSSPLNNMATSDVYWDEIVSIESVGSKQVYDLTIPETHNFVANDICVHNTAFCLNMAANASTRFNKVSLFCSLEMSAQQLAMRLLASEARVDVSRIRTGQLKEHEWRRLIQATATLSKAPIFIDDTPALNPQTLLSRARRLKVEHGLDMIMVDYLQLMSASGPGVSSREQVISEISRTLKLIAKDLNIPVIALAQLNRGVESRADKRPMLSDLRESGAIEQDADIISFVYRDEYYNEDSEAKGIAEIIIGKHRSGSTGTVQLRFFPEYTRFENLARDDED